MPAPCLESTRAALGASFERCDSRSLWFERFADPLACDAGKQQYFSEAMRISIDSGLGKTRSAYLSRVSSASSRFQARLESRLMVNMAGGVMENANLCLDRFSGLPFIPGSAVKGCARRMALQQLRDSVEAKPDAYDDHASKLADIALIFGWGDGDWQTDRNKKGNLASDFFWATMEQTGILVSAAQLLAQALNVSIPESQKNQPWKSLPSFGGSVAFHAAWPSGAPQGSPLGALELDVLTSHHPEYYQGKRKTATDDENPIPVVFPAVKAGHVFTFALAPLRRAPESRVALACSYLKEGLSIFGIGAKTNAGYGWFTILDGRSASVDLGLSAASAIPVPLGDYSDKTFDNLVITRLNKPQEYNLLQGDKGEVAKLKKPENSEWLEKLKTHLASPSGRDARKRLKGKNWFPQEWLG